MDASVTMTISKKKGEEIVSETAANLRMSLSEGVEDFHSLFMEIIRGLGNQRREIAERDWTRDAERFGLPRFEAVGESFSSPDKPSFIFVSPIHGYEKYNRRLLKVFERNLRPIDAEAPGYRKFQKLTTEKVAYPHFSGTVCEVAHGSSSDTVISSEIFNETNIRSLMEEHAFTEESMRRMYDLAEMAYDDEIPLQKLARDLSCSFDGMQKIKQKAPRTYKMLKVFNGMEFLRERYREGADGQIRRMTDFMVATPRSPIDNKLYALTTYMTWTNRDFKSSPVDHMLERSVVLLVHQDQYLLPAMLKDISGLFERVIKTPRKELSTINSLIAEIQHKFSHAAPFYRGSAAVGEWLEKVLYRFHDYDCRFDSDFSVNLEALTLSMDQFIEDHDQFVQVEDTLPAPVQG